MKLLKSAMIVVLFVAASAAVSWAAAKIVQMSVQIQSGTVRAAPSHFSKVLFMAPYASRHEVVEEREGWCKVVVAGQNLDGWMHKSALTPKNIVLSDGDGAAGKGSSGGVSTDESIAAGKGFNNDVEMEYRASHAELDYAWVDKMERRTVSSDEVLAFARAGGLAVEEAKP